MWHSNDYKIKSSHRYKVTCPATWPTYHKDLKDGCNLIIREQKFENDEVKFGNTKIFIKNPRTIFKLEEERSKKLPMVVLQMQRVIFPNFIFYRKNPKNHVFSSDLDRRLNYFRYHVFSQFSALLSAALKSMKIK